MSLIVWNALGDRPPTAIFQLRTVVLGGGLTLSWTKPGLTVSIKKVQTHAGVLLDSRALSRGTAYGIAQGVDVVNVKWQIHGEVE